MLTKTVNLQEEAAKLADCLARGHHYAAIHLARLINMDAGGALRPFAAALGAQIRADLESQPNPRLKENRLAELDTMLYELLCRAAQDWTEPGYWETTGQPEIFTCQAIRVNGQRCNAPVAEGHRLCRYHLNHESDR